jgi:hypothetical protein
MILSDHVYHKRKLNRSAEKLPEKTVDSNTVSQFILVSGEGKEWIP